MTSLDTSLRTLCFSVDNARHAGGHELHSGVFCRHYNNRSNPNGGGVDGAVAGTVFVQDAVLDEDVHKAPSGD